MNGGAAGLVGGAVGLALGFALAPRKVAASSAPSLPCGPTEAGRWAVQKGITALFVSNTDDVARVPSGAKYVVVQSTCTVYAWQGRWVADGALTAELQTFVRSGAPAPSAPLALPAGEATETRYTQHQLTPNPSLESWWFITGGYAPGGPGVYLAPDSEAFYSSEALAEAAWLWQVEHQEPKLYPAAALYRWTAPLGIAGKWWLVRSLSTGTDLGYENRPV